MKKLVNLIALVMLVSTNVLTPFSYAQVETPELIPENEVENIEESLWETEEISEINEETPELEPEGTWELEQERYVDETSEDENMDENLELEQLQEPVVMETISWNSAILLSWQQFNDEIRSLTTGQIEKMIQWTWDVPLWVDTKVVSAPYSDNIVEMWFDEWIIYYHTDADKIYFNPDSSSMFFNMSISELDLRNFDVSRVTDMSNMFALFWGAILNVDWWNTSNVKNIWAMFSYASIRVIYSSNDWDLNKVQTVGNIFWDWCVRWWLWSQFCNWTWWFKVDNLQQSGMFTSDIIAVNFWLWWRQIIHVWEKPEFFVPSITGYTFSWWYTDSSYSQEYDFNKELYKYTEIYPKLIPLKYEVTFNTNWWTEIEPVYVGSGTYISYPGDPTREWSIFLWRYADKNFKDQWSKLDFMYLKPITRDMNFYAKWDWPWYEFDANWWKFDDVDSKNIVKYKSNTQIWNRWCFDGVWCYVIPYDCHGDTKWFRDVIKFEWSKNLHIIFEWETWLFWALYIFSWDYTWSTDTWYLHKIGNYNSWIKDLEFDIEWDSITILWIWYNWYGGASYFAIIYPDERYTMDGEVKTPTREWYDFMWWVDDETAEDYDPNAPVTWDKKFYAKWKCAQWYVDKQWQCVKEETKPSWGSSGWWGGWGWSSKKTDEDTHWSADDSQKNTQDDKNTENVIQRETKWSEESINTPIDSSDKSSEWQEILSLSDSPSSAGQVSFTKEQKDAYTFAKENWITTKDTIQSAQMNGKLTRIAMAKMLSQYAINVLWQTPDTSKTIKFRDVTSKKDADYDNWVTLAYQLWIMWQNMPNNRFRPNDEVSRAEFATALSRLLYQTTDGEYKSTKEYYIPHMAKLYNEWIISNTDPSMAERRWYVMIMLMRSAK